MDPAMQAMLNMYQRSPRSDREHGYPDAAGVDRDSTALCSGRRVGPYEPKLPKKQSWTATRPPRADPGRLGPERHRVPPGLARAGLRFQSGSPISQGWR